MNYTRLSRRNRRGTNQHKVRSRGTWKRWFYGFLAAVFLVVMFAEYFKSVGYSKAFAEAPIISPVPSEFNIEIEAEEEIDTTPETEEIRAYIKEVFGKDADKAFKVLSCENSKLDPTAVNTAGNVPEGSRDTGIFQINEYWQKVQYRFLLNWKINVQIAHQIFVDNGHSFERWTCGRKLGV